MLIFRTLSAISKLTRRRALFLFLLLYVDRLKAQLIPQPLTHDNVIKPTPSQYAPVLKVKSTEGYLPELSEVGTTVRISPSLHADSLQILVEDADLKPGMPPAIYQYILTGYGAEKFAVDQRGYLYLNDADIDADKNSSTYQLHIQAREVDTQPVRSSEPISLTIHIIDVNDNPPTFSSPVYTANVSANEAGERTVLKIVAQDLDAGKFGKISYRISQVVPNNPSGAFDHFRYDETTNELKAIGRLNPGEQYQILLEARDGGGLMGKTVILVFAMDDDMSREYSTEMANVAPNMVYPGTSVVSPQPLVINAGFKQFPMMTPYPIAGMTTPAPLWPMVTFSPTKGGKGGNGQEESTEPVQTLITEINEATPPNSIVVSLGDDETRSKIYFTIADGNEDGKFGINSETGTLITVAELDREKMDMYTLQIEARSRNPDQSLYWTIIQVTVKDVNDNAPEFLDPQPIKLHLSIDDVNEFAPNLKVGRIKVRDLDADDNGRITLRIMPPMNRLFTIDQHGEIKVNGEFTTDHFGEHRLSIIATDHGDPPLESRGNVHVTIDGTLVTQGREKTEEEVEYSEENEIESNSYTTPTMFSMATLPPTDSDPAPAPSPFTVPHITNSEETYPPPRTTINRPGVTPGRHTYQSIKPSTIFETKPYPTMPPTSPPLPPLRLAPVFIVPQLSVMVDENEGDMELATLEAKYPDGLPGTVTYVMQAGDPSLFSISSFTGMLTLLRPLDAEADQEYIIRIGTAESSALATDPKYAHSSTITIKVLDVNDWIPNFETNSYAFAVTANTEPGTIIGQVAAFDQDRDAPNNKIHYKLINTDGMEKYFGVNTENGLITLNRGVKEFVEQKITLRVEATDEGDPPQSTQTIVIIDVEASESEVIPQGPGGLPTIPEKGAIQFSLRNYTASIPEDKRPPHLVQIMPVLNKPTDSRFIMCSIVSGNFRGAFSISPGQDGNCELRTQMSLDRETVERYLLNVTVTLNQQTDFALVSITVLDANDNVPKFIYTNGLDLATYFSGVPANAPAFARILTVKAEDNDIGNSSNVQYDLDPLSVDAKFFSIGKSSGEISIKQSMAQIVQKNRKSFFEFRVTACDSPISGQQLCSKADVIVNVVSDQHRFITTIKGSQPTTIRAHEEDLIKAFRQFTGSCTLITMEQQKEKPAGFDGVEITEVFWYAVNPSTKKICKKHEYRKLFDTSTKDMIAGKLSPWFTLDKIQENFAGALSGYDVEFGPEDFGIFPSDWKTASTVLIGLAIAIAVGAIVGICAICVYWNRYKAKQAAVHAYPNIYPMPKYGTVYLPTNGTFDKDKIYETQMLELPISDEDYTVKNSSVRSTEPMAPRRNGNDRHPVYTTRVDSMSTTRAEHLNHHHHHHQHSSNSRNMPSRNYGRQHSIHEGDFSIEESMYAINTPGRMDPITKYLY
uniref:Cadherin domain-containing protein n=1 Tax=Acrobeloides nanus TaxID=290746 RepID=A0A914DJN7_9BILA